MENVVLISRGRMDTFQKPLTFLLLFAFCTEKSENRKVNQRSIKMCSLSQQFKDK